MPQSLLRACLRVHPGSHRPNKFFYNLMRALKIYHTHTQIKQNCHTSCMVGLLASLSPCFYFFSSLHTQCLYVGTSASSPSTPFPPPPTILTPSPSLLHKHKNTLKHKHTDKPPTDSSISAWVVVSLSHRPKPPLNNNVHAGQESQMCGDEKVQGFFHAGVCVYEHVCMFSPRNLPVATLGCQELNMPSPVI